MESTIDILLAEDNEDDAQLTIRAMKPYVKNKVLWLKNGVEVLDFLIARHSPEEFSPEQLPRVIFLDLKMPKMDGIAVLKELKSHEMTKTIPVVVVTSSKENKDLKTCYDLGANSYVVKPIDFDQFMTAAKSISQYWLGLNEPPT